MHLKTKRKKPLRYKIIYSIFNYLPNNKNAYKNNPTNNKN